jgi:FKBP-type peptidyl-prolyl cis-trans isomerase FkpA
MRIASLLLPLVLLTSACTERTPDAPAPEPAEPVIVAPEADDAATPTPPDLVIALSGDPLETTTTDSGVIIETYAPGEGDPSTSGDRLRVVFRAMLADGTVFRSSEQMNTPMTIPLEDGRAVPGLLEGLIGMRPGAERRIRVPWQQGYGENGRPPVPGRTDLIFDVRVLSVN